MSGAGIISLPRLVVAGLAGDAGKTLVCAGMLRAFARRGIKIAPFKKGPDYLDPAWLGAAAGCPARNLDTYLMSDSALLESLAGARAADLAVIEGNRGLYDGQDAQGSHSTAELAKRLQAPVVLVVDVSKSTRTVAALVLGCTALDPDLQLGGVILNRVGTCRQERLIREALASVTHVPVLGAIPRLPRDPLPSRHLGLLMPTEREDCEPVLDLMADAVLSGVDLAAVEGLARTAPPLPYASPASVASRPGLPIRIGYLKDEAFSFYYAENLTALETHGATLVPISPIHDQRLPEIDALYAGGGYPEEHAPALAANLGFRAALADRIACGLPVWAECGGLMYLARALIAKGRRYPMVGALPVAVEQTDRVQGHGYVDARVDADNPFFPMGTRLRGHEFHYSKLAAGSPGLATALSLDRGVGIGNRRDGIVAGCVFASYLHIFAPGTPAWAPALLRVAEEARMPPPLYPIAIGDHSGIDNSRRRAD